jgi:hypothetical protein
MRPYVTAAAVRLDVSSTYSKRVRGSGKYRISPVAENVHHRLLEKAAARAYDSHRDPTAAGLMAVLALQVAGCGPSSAVVRGQPRKSMA